MKKIENKELDSPFRSYKSLINTALDQGEAKIPIIRKAVKIGQALDKADKFIEIDDEDHFALIQFVENAEYGLMDREGNRVNLSREWQLQLIEFIDYIKSL